MGCAEAAPEAQAYAIAKVLERLVVRRVLCTVLRAGRQTSKHKC